MCVLNEIEMAYQQYQNALVRDGAYGIGDLVKIVYRAESKSNVWGTFWEEEMDNYVGYVGEITGIDNFYACGIEVKFVNGDRWSFPVFVLELVRKQRKEVQSSSDEELKPFQQVLCRDFESDKWFADIYSHYIDDEDVHCCVGGTASYVIPYEGNEDKLGKE